MSRSTLAEWRDAVRDSGLDSSAKAIAHVLSTYMNGGGECWPSQQLLAAGSSFSDRTVQLATERLERAGFLAISRSRGRSSHRYVATLPTAKQLRGSGRANPEVDASNPEVDASNPEAASYESAESAESSDGAAASRGAPPLMDDWIEGVSMPRGPIQ